jgi:predicted MFS family arabinose efflux permease
LSAGGVITVELLVLLSLALGVLAGLDQPARLALIPSLVAKDDIITAIAINSIVFNLARFVGPAIAGLIITTVGPAAAFAFNAASYLWFIRVLFTMRALPQEAGAGRGPVIAQITEAVHYAARHPLIGPLLLIVATSSLFARPFTELLPGIADTVFSRGADGLAILVSSVGIGAVAGSLWLAKRGDLHGMTRVVVFALLIVGISEALAVTVGAFWLATALLAVFGVSMVVLGAGVQSMIQASVAPEMRGRVLSLSGLVMRGAPALGALFMGWAGDHVGLGPPLVAGAVVCGIVFLVMLRHEPRLSMAAERGSLPAPL